MYAVSVSAIDFLSVGPYCTVLSDDDFYSICSLHICSPWGARSHGASRQSPNTHTVRSLVKILSYAPTRSVVDTAPPNTGYLLLPILRQRYLQTE